MLPLIETQWKSFPFKFRLTMYTYQVVRLSSPSATSSIMIPNVTTQSRHVDLWIVNTWRPGVGCFLITIISQERKTHLNFALHAPYHSIQLYSLAVNSVNAMIQRKISISSFWKLYCLRKIEYLASMHWIFVTISVPNWYYQSTINFVIIISVKLKFRAVWVMSVQCDVYVLHHSTMYQFDSSLQGVLRFHINRL